VVFDCVRVSWVVMIVCILFFEMSLLRSMVVAATVGLGWLLCVRMLQNLQTVVASGTQPPQPPQPQPLLPQAPLVSVAAMGQPVGAFGQPPAQPPAQLAAAAVGPHQAESLV
jgi:hypothetical protein